MFFMLAEAAQQAGFDAPMVAALDAGFAGLIAEVQALRAQLPTPVAARGFELALEAQLRACGRALVEWAYHHLEPPAPQVVARGRVHRFVNVSPRRGGLDTLFGTVPLARRVYRRADGANRNVLAPLDHWLGVVHCRASPALAERIAAAAAERTQGETLAWLARDHGVRWNAGQLRRAVRTLAKELEPQRLEVAAARLRALLEQARKSKGRQRPTLALGRDGVMVPAVGGACQEAAAATLTVYDRRGRRLGTVYLGRMYEFRQETLSRQATELLDRVLRAWSGPLPRLCYVTDCGSHPRDYWRDVLRTMKHPVTGAKLAWIRVVDFYHAGTYVTKLGEALFGAGRGAGWVRTMRHALRHDPRGVACVLRSAAAHRRERREWTAAQEKLYREGTRYLRKHRRWMNYRALKNAGLPIGSGVTEAACKTVFAQRLKRSGMRWTIAGGQAVVDLRTLKLSGLLAPAYARALAARALPQTCTAAETGSSHFGNAA